VADIDHKALAALILGDCEAIEVFARSLHDVDEVPPATFSKMQLCKDHLEQALTSLNEPSEG
jgi:hypothetical protein